jgi:hypothetical protein
MNRFEIMKYEATIKIQYRKRKLLKRFIVNKVIGETHAKKVLNDNMKIKHPNRRYELLSLNEVN